MLTIEMTEQWNLMWKKYIKIISKVVFPFVFLFDDGIPQ